MDERPDNDGAVTPDEYKENPLKQIGGSKVPTPSRTPTEQEKKKKF